MKTVTQHAISEIAYYECDVSGEPLPEGPPVTISIHCGYGSPFDGTDLELHLSGKAAEAVLPLLRALLLGGEPLGKHAAENSLNWDGWKEARIGRRETAALLQKLSKLRRLRKRNRVEPSAGSTGMTGRDRTRSGRTRARHCDR